MANKQRELEKLEEIYADIDHADAILCEPKRWTKGTLHRRKQGCDAFCLIGSFNRSRVTIANIDSIYKDAKDPVIDAVKIRICSPATDWIEDNMDFPRGDGDIASFNDHRKTTFEDVKKFLADAKKAVIDRYHEVKSGKRKTA